MPLRSPDRGPVVTAFQEALIAAGYDLPRWGADGVYGDETDAAAELFADQNAIIKAPGISGDELIARVLAAGRVAAPGLPLGFIDARDLHPGASRLRRRGWGRINSITLHQTATCYVLPGATMGQVHTAVRRVAKIGVHAVVLRTGHAVLSNDVIWEVPQAQWFNTKGIGIELDGWFEGIEGRPETLWQPEGHTRRPMAEEPAQTAAALALIDYFVELVGANGGQIKYLNAHRQTSATRVSDPGGMLWRTIAIPAMKKHGLTYGAEGQDPQTFYVRKSRGPGGELLDLGGAPGSIHGPGRPIPREWDPSATAKY